VGPTIADLTTVQVDRFGMKDDDATPEPHVDSTGMHTTLQ